MRGYEGVLTTNSRLKLVYWYISLECCLPIACKRAHRPPIVDSHRILTDDAMGM